MADTFTILTLNEKVDEALIAGLDDPLKAETLKLSLANMDKATGNWVTPKDAAIKEAFWPEIQAALLGQKDPQEALDAAESKVNRALRRR
jgi:ABC-type glycerol-3-phosphate transport system substrate-binding protein